MPKFGSVRFFNYFWRTENRTESSLAELNRNQNQNRKNRFCRFCSVLEPVRTVKPMKNPQFLMVIHIYLFVITLLLEQTKHLDESRYLEKI
ncbi:hypothetical protein BYT27DRAFT_6494337 [Phlegmacium glaucopus]|nr:hypothetical protein BYT27DRAFT_6494337 [Phlegmacium glaucopus]